MALLCLLSFTKFSQAQFTDFSWHRGFMLGITTLPAVNYFPDSAALFNYPWADSISATNRLAYQIGLNWGARINLYTINDDQSLSLQADVIASIYLNQAYLMDDLLGETSYGFQIPIYVNYNIGHMATKNAVGDRGFGIGLGVELNSFRYAANDPTNSSFRNYDRRLIESNTGFWMQPMLNLGYRYWRNDNLARELNLQFGFGYIDRLSTGNSFRPNVRLSVHKFINY